MSQLERVQTTIAKLLPAGGAKCRCDWSADQLIAVRVGSRELVLDSSTVAAMTAGELESQLLSALERAGLLQ